MKPNHPRRYNNDASPAIPTYSGSTFSAYPSPLSAAGRSKGEQYHSSRITVSLISHSCYSVVIGAAVGGTVGGLVVIASIAALVVLYCGERNRHVRLLSEKSTTTNQNTSRTLQATTTHSPEPYMKYSPYSTYTTTTPPPICHSCDIGWGHWTMSDVVHGLYLV